MVLYYPWMGAQPCSSPPTLSCRAFMDSWYSQCPAGSRRSVDACSRQAGAWPSHGLSINQWPLPRRFRSNTCSRQRRKKPQAGKFAWVASLALTCLPQSDLRRGPCSSSGSAGWLSEWGGQFPGMDFHPNLRPAGTCSQIAKQSPGEPRLLLLCCYPVM